MISTLVIVGLIVVWSIVLLPDIVSRISVTRRGDTIRSFNSQLSSLGRSAPAGRESNVIDLRGRIASKPNGGSRSGGRNVPSASSFGAAHTTGARTAVPTAAPRPLSPAVRKRRQDVLLALGAGALLTLLATLAFGGAFLYLHLLADVLLATYLVLLQRAVATRPVAQVGAQRLGGSEPMGALAPLGGAVGRSHNLEPRRIAN